jgi:hypothetical protein
MAASTSRETLYRLARLGAKARIAELQAELALLEQTLGQEGIAAPSAAAPRRTRGWTPAQRKAAAERVRAFWAKRKAAAGKAAGSKQAAARNSSTRKKAAKKTQKRAVKKRPTSAGAKKSSSTLAR